ncbi:hypothetical protein GCM10011381_38730 [Klenkia taihuensis]|uniref:DUF559 domain-containing protein n=1 Tax=Klenkia taihuensis TaxID=1225127 RepID=A0A1I1UKB2_9ACTN|nr:hypothetical protein GCM10011381_38730 [Klenkia taihuensis]SFD71197.1 Protein of unknown function [Klenkia taihuensis]
MGRWFRGSDVVARGLLTAGELRGPAWRRVFPDVYVDAACDVDHALLARIAATTLAPGAVVTGVSAAVLWGLTDLAGVDDPVELTVAPGAPRPSCPGVVVRRRALPSTSSVRRGTVLVATPETAALELAGRLDPVEAVVLLDRCVAERISTLAALRQAAAGLAGRGCRRARAAADRADGQAGSPQETRLRLLVLDAGLLPPLAQFTVRVEGRFVARVDFAWPDHRIALEYEGAWHTTRVAADRRRIEALQAAGWRVLFVTAADLRRPAPLLARIRAALASNDS